MVVKDIGFGGKLILEDLVWIDWLENVVFVGVVIK